MSYFRIFSIQFLTVIQKYTINLAFTILPILLLFRNSPRSKANLSIRRQATPGFTQIRRNLIKYKFNFNNLTIQFITSKDNNMQVIDKPKQSILPFSIRKKVMTQQSLSKVQTYRITPARKHKLKLKLKKLEEYKRPKFMCYQLGGIDNGTRKQIKTILNENVRIMRSKKNASVLLPDNFIHNMSENMKGITYNSAKYLAIVPYIQDIFVGVLAIPENNIMMAIGEISQNFYLFFDNCFEIPYSLCCNQIIYLKMELVKQFSRSVSLRKHQSYQNQLEIRSIKTQLICRKCKGQIIYFYGEDLLTKFDRYSPQRLKKDIQEQDQRRKFSIGIMVGSGKHKSYRIDDTKKYQSCLSRKFNPESIFTTNLYDSTTKRSGYQAISHKTTTLSQPKTLRNDFYQLFNQ